MSKLLLAALSVVFAQDQPPSSKCLSCKHKDTLSSFLYSASYCADKDECLEDQWNYKNNWCVSGWKQGWKLNIDEDCNARDGGAGSCKGF